MTLLTVLQKLELCAHRAAHKYPKGSNEYDMFKLFAYELMGMQKEVEREERQSRIETAQPIAKGGNA